jgi:hypothetical protein
MIGIPGAQCRRVAMSVGVCGTIRMVANFLFRITMPYIKR